MPDPDQQSDRDLSYAIPPAPGKCPVCGRGNKIGVKRCEGYVQRSNGAITRCRRPINGPRGLDFEDFMSTYNAGLNGGQASGEAVDTGDQEVKADITAYVLLVLIACFIFYLGQASGNTGQISREAVDTGDQEAEADITA
ncbi:Ff.00g043650.m01.CDS01 [Fusarium sp. VM40]|nr:Ff.00g043650.m01.CDS01 [Fusarium sp. VM40]